MRLPIPCSHHGHFFLVSSCFFQFFVDKLLWRFVSCDVDFGFELYFLLTEVIKFGLVKILIFFLSFLLLSQNRWWNWSLLYNLASSFLLSWRLSLRICKLFLFFNFFFMLGCFFSYFLFFLLSTMVFLLLFINLFCSNSFFLFSFLLLNLLSLNRFLILNNKAILHLLFVFKLYSCLFNLLFLLNLFLIFTLICFHHFIGNLLLDFG
jgi:hypothetical protein